SSRVSGVLSDLEGDYLNLVAELQADAIAPRWHQWPQGERVPALLLRRVDLDRRGRHMPAVPHEPVKALPPRRPRFLWTPGLGLLVLGAPGDRELRLTFLDSAGEEIRSFSAAPGDEPVQH